MVYSLYNFYGATMTMKDSLYLSIPCYSGFCRKKILGYLRIEQSKIGPQNGGFSGI